MHFRSGAILRVAVFLRLPVGTVRISNSKNTVVDIWPELTLLFVSEVTRVVPITPGSPRGAHHGGATHSSGLTDLMLGTHICIGITYKSKYYRISHIIYRLLNRISINFQPLPSFFLYITLYLAIALTPLPLNF